MLTYAQKYKPEQAGENRTQQANSMATRKQRRKEAKAKALLDKCVEVSQEVSHLLLLGNVAADFGTSPQQVSPLVVLG